MDSINFCAIAPTKYLHLTKGRPYHLVLAHLIEVDEEYTNFYRNESENGSIIIVDNSAFEMYKQKREMYSSDKLIEMGRKVKGHYIVLSDYPNEPGQTTIDAAEKLIPIFKEAGFKTFFVPQSKIGDLDDYLDTWNWAAQNKDIDLIGLSILGAPNAFGVESNNKLQRYLSRYHIMDKLYDEGILALVGSKRIHCLGMTDGPNELKLLKTYQQYILTVDSSSPVWAGINNIPYDESPTGLINGKFELEVDFDIPLQPTTVELIMSNLNKLDDILSPS